MGLSYRMSRHDAGENRSITHAQPTDTIDAELRIDNAILREGGHAARTDGMIKCLHPFPDQFFELRVRFRLEAGIEIGVLGIDVEDGS